MSNAQDLSLEFMGLGLIGTISTLFGGYLNSTGLGYLTDTSGNILTDTLGNQIQYT
jgi:hypothetical protein